MLSDQQADPKVFRTAHFKVLFLVGISLHIDIDGAGLSLYQYNHKLSREHVIYVRLSDDEQF